VHVGLQTDAAHAYGISHAILSIHDELLRDHMQDLPVGRHGHVGRVLEQTLHVGFRDFAIPGRDRDDPTGLETLDVISGNAHNDIVHGHPSHALGFFDRIAYGGHGLVDVDDNTPVQALRFGDADSQNLDTVQLI